MPQRSQLNTKFSRRFFAPVTDLYSQSDRQYKCTAISDIHFCQLGVLPCLSSSVTGQEFLQYHADQNVANIISLNDLLALPMNRDIPDPYSQCSELDCWDTVIRIRGG